MFSAVRHIVSMTIFPFHFIAFSNQWSKVYNFVWSVVCIKSDSKEIIFNNFRIYLWKICVVLEAAMYLLCNLWLVMCYYMWLRISKFIWILLIKRLRNQKKFSPNEVSSEQWTVNAAPHRLICSKRNSFDWNVQRRGAHGEWFSFSQSEST